MAIPRNQPISNVSGLEQQGAQACGTPITPCNPGAAALTVTGNYPARLATAPKQPALFLFDATAAAAVVLTTPAAGGYVAGDVIRTRSKATLTNSVTIRDVVGPTTLVVLPTTVTYCYADIVFDGTVWTYYEGGGL